MEGCQRIDLMPGTACEFSFVYLVLGYIPAQWALNKMHMAWIWWADFVAKRLVLRAWQPHSPPDIDDWIGILRVSDVSRKTFLARNGMPLWSTLTMVTMLMVAFSLFSDPFRHCNPWMWHPPEFHGQHRDCWGTLEFCILLPPPTYSGITE